MIIDDGEIKAYILRKLASKGKWGHSHTSFENIRKWIPQRDLGKEGYKRVNELAKELVREGLILTKPTHYGLEVSLNPRESRRIDEIIKRYYPEE
jgi:hypothetical protein